MCVNALTGDRERNSTFWVILGYDDVAERFRCLKFAGKPVVDQLKQECNFVPAQATAATTSSDEDIAALRAEINGMSRDELVRLGAERLGQFSQEELDIYSEALVDASKP
jgi:hypothetical protein